MNELKNVEDLIAKLDAVADDLEHHPTHKVESQVVRTPSCSSNRRPTTPGMTLCARSRLSRKGGVLHRG